MHPIVAQRAMEVPFEGLTSLNRSLDRYATASDIKGSQRPLKRTPHIRVVIGLGMPKKKISQRPGQNIWKKRCHLSLFPGLSTLIILRLSNRSVHKRPDAAAPTYRVE